MKVAVIANPLSQRNKGGLDRLEAFVRDRADLLYHRLDDFSALPAVLSDWADSGVTTLALCGGDGTVQAALTELLEGQPFETLPLIAVLPAGMTNMIAADVGVKGRPHDSLARVLAILQDGDPAPNTHSRRLLRVDNIKDFTPQAGMFFGGSGIVRAILACRRHVHRLKFESELANGVTLAGLVLRWLLRGGRPDDVFHADAIAIGLDGAAPENRDCALVLASTLEKLTLNSRPFWNLGAGDFYFTTVDYPPPKLARSLLRLLGQGEDRKLPDPGYSSQGAKRVELTMECPFTLDGQLFRPQAGKPLVLTAPAVASFLRA